MHDPTALPRPSYAYLLGMYLGDGDISRYPRTWRLRIALDMMWPGIMNWCAMAMQEVFPENKVSFSRPDPRSWCAVVSVYSKQIVCLFPQHGAGPKHLRRIALANWQAKIVKNWPKPFLRGLIHSDGCRSLNTVRGAKKMYSYSRYTFSNRSEDIRDLFTASCDQLGIEWRQMNRWNISIARRESVARLDEFVGPKN
jgi:hypothetical protein